MEQRPERPATAEPVWFGPARRPLFGWLHRPAGDVARGGVVLCPPIGVERLSADRGLSALADSLAGAGLLALRLDYDGTGDSSGMEDDPDRLRLWIASVGCGLALLRDAGVQQLAAVGLRVGALVAALAGSSDGALDAVVLWDPSSSGRSFVREQAALRAVSIGPPPLHEAAATGGTLGSGVAPGSESSQVEILGSVLSPAHVAELERLELTSIDGPVAKRVLAVLRRERPPRRPVSEHLAAWDADVLAVDGQPELVDALPDSSQVPVTTVEAITSWLAGCFAGVRPVPLRTPETLGDSVAVEREVIERPRRLGRIGLFAIESAPSGRSDGPTVVFLNAGLIQHTGPSRLWVTLSRRLAAAGMRAVRLDLSGLGESPARPGQRPHLVYPVEALEDITEAVRALEAENPDGVVLSGLCSGAYHSIEGGIALRVRGVVPINPWMSFDPEEVRQGGELAQGRTAVRPYDGWIKPLLRFRRLADVGDRRAPVLVLVAAHQAPPLHQSRGRDRAPCRAGRPDDADLRRPRGPAVHPSRACHDVPPAAQRSRPPRAPAGQRPHALRGGGALPRRARSSSSTCSARSARAPPRATRRRRPSPRRPSPRSRRSPIGRTPPRRPPPRSRRSPIGRTPRRHAAPTRRRPERSTPRPSRRPGPSN